MKATMHTLPAPVPVLLVALMASVAVVPRAALAVSTADQICAPTDDPCLINTVIEVDDGSILDFGTRAVVLSGNGELDTGAGTVTVLCGNFTAAGLTGTSTVAIRARGTSLSGAGNDGGFFELRTQRRCSESFDSLCTKDRDCDAGLCTTHVCTGDRERACLNDDGCNTGSCIFNPSTGTARCQQSSQRCDTDADCSFGTCDLGTTQCSDDFSRNCLDDSECADGMCIVGTGDVDIDGRLRGDGQVAGSITIIAAGGVRLRQDVNLNSANREEDAGLLQIVSNQGDVIIDAKLSGVGGGASQGGDFTISSGRDLIIKADIDLTGGEFDGGLFDADAVRDITILGDIAANSVNADGFGGEITLIAGRDINIPGPARWSTNGHEGDEQFCGDAGAQDIDAGRNLFIGPGVILEADGPAPDCVGEEINLTVGNDAFIAGRLSVKGVGVLGAGGLLEITSDGSVSLTADARIDVTGGADGGGTIDVGAARDLFFDANVDATASSGGGADTILLSSGCLMSMGGTIETGGVGGNGVVEIQGGDVLIRAGGSVVNKGSASQNLIRGAEFVTIQAGAVVEADAATGVNQITYRNAAVPPIINGTVSPVASLVVNSAIPRAPCICGNGILENGESCDDGNHNDGDGCSSACQAEACVAATPGYPAVPLCDDNNGCTVDSCNSTTRTCQHVLNCDDGIACTTDTCTLGNVCRHQPNDGLCNDGNLCTENLCTESAGCLLTFTTSACNDSIGCTENDVCDRGVCLGTPDCPPGALCDLELGQCIETISCGNGVVEPPEQCDDGDTVWEDGQFCNASCTMLSCGDPNDSGGNANASDALFVLRSAVALEMCDPCICNVDSSVGAVPVTASDALRTLQAAVGVPVSLACPACG